MNKKILASIFVIGILALAMGYGTYSYFSDTETSTDNTFTAGTLHTALSNDGVNWFVDVTHTWVSPSNWAPGEYVESKLYIRNDGTINVMHVAYEAYNLGGTGLADAVLLTKIVYTEGGVAYDVTDWFKVTAGMDVNSDGKITLREFVDGWPYAMKFWTGAWGGSTEYLTASGGNSQYLLLGFTFDSAAGNEYQGKTASFDLEVRAYQSWLQAPYIAKGAGCYGYA